jgi:hypothetical protein
LPGTAETQEVALLGLVVVLAAIVLVGVDIRDLDYSECDVIEEDGPQDD